MAGNFQVIAMLNASCRAPWRTAPSPKYVIETLPVLLYFSAKARPAPNGIWAPTIPWPPTKPTSLSKMCMEPPFPFEAPVILPYNSAIMALGEVPKAKGIPWSRYAVMYLSPSCRADFEPEEQASCPIYKWQKPLIFCIPYNWPHFSSNLRCNCMDSYQYL